MLHCFWIELGVSVWTECAHLSGALICAIQVLPITLGCEDRVLGRLIARHKTWDEKNSDECSHETQLIDLIVADLSAKPISLTLFCSRLSITGAYGYIGLPLLIILLASDAAC